MSLDLTQVFCFWKICTLQPKLAPFATKKNQKSPIEIIHGMLTAFQWKIKVLIIIIKDKIIFETITNEIFYKHHEEWDHFGPKLCLNERVMAS